MLYSNYTENDITFVICAYKECKYLEDAIVSLVNQTKHANILISTSTPNEFIFRLAKKYSVDVRINCCGGQINDYNFAMQQGDTPLVMLMHQDEILRPEYLERVLWKLNHSKNPAIIFTDYLEMHNDVIDRKASIMVRIKRIMLFPAKCTRLMQTKFGKRLILLLGDPITHPTVLYVRDKMPEIVYREEYKASMDYDLWERLSLRDGTFVYVDDILLYHRMNDENQTVKLLNTSNERYENEYDVLCRFWPKAVAKIIMRFYSKATKYY